MTMRCLLSALLACALAAAPAACDKNSRTMADNDANAAKPDGAKNQSAGTGVGNQASAEKRFFLEDTENRQWCLYRLEKDFKQANQQSGAMVVGHVSYANGRAAAVEVVETDETGDWMVIDQYALGTDAQPQRLKRQVNILPGERTEDLVFDIRAGRAEQRSRAAHRLNSDKPLEGEADTWLPEVPVIASRQDFGFVALIDRNPKTLPDTLCTPAKSEP